MLPFSGSARPLGPTDIADAARAMGVQVEAVQAVYMVETGGAGGFLADGSGRPRILFESRLFGDATGHRFDASHPTISTRVNNWKLYRAGAAEYDRLNAAVALDREAALRATSWGLFQVLGSNAVALGYRDVEAMVAAMAESEQSQLAAFMVFCKVNGLIPYLRETNWSAFARAYNGPDYSANGYDMKLAAAFLMAAGHLNGVVRLGSQGHNVVTLQLGLVKLGYPLLADGCFGTATELALRRFQSMHGLTVDGIAGPATVKALGVVLS